MHAINFFFLSDKVTRHACALLTVAKMPARHNKRPMLRVSAGVGSNLSLRAIQEEVAKNGAAKRSAGWSAFSFQAFSVSSLTDVLQKEGIEDAQAAISHASVQVQVRSQLIAHMNKEVASEASAALTAVQSAAKAAKEAAAKASAADAGSTVMNAAGNQLADHGGADADEERLAEAWESAFLRLRRLVDAAARQQSAGGASSTTSATDDAPANLRLDELTAMLLRARRRTAPRRTLHRPVPPPAAADGLCLLERWEAAAREADAAGAAATVDGADAYVGMEEDAASSRSVDAAGLMPDDASWWHQWPADVIGAQAPSDARAASALMSEWLQDDDAASEYAAGWEGEGDEPIDMAQARHEHGAGVDERAVPDNCTVEMDLFADDGLCASRHPSPSPSRSPSSVAMGAVTHGRASHSGEDATAPDDTKARRGASLRDETLREPVAPSAQVVTQVEVHEDSILGSDDDAFESAPRRAPPRSQVRTAVAMEKAARRRRVVLSDEDDSDEAEPRGTAAKHTMPPKQLRRTSLPASQARLLSPTSAAPYAPDAMVAPYASDTLGTSLPVTPAGGGTASSLAARTGAASRPFALLVDFGANGERSGPLPERSAAAHKPFKLAIDHEKHLFPPMMLAEPVALPYGLQPVVTKRGGGGGDGAGGRWQFILPPAACDVKRRGAAIFSRLLTQDCELEEWLQCHKQRRWKQSREEAAAPHLAAFVLQEDGGKELAASAALAALEAQRMLRGRGGDGGDGGEGDEGSDPKEHRGDAMDGFVMDSSEEDGGQGSDVVRSLVVDAEVPARKAGAALDLLRDQSRDDGEGAFDDEDDQGGGFEDQGGGFGDHGGGFGDHGGGFNDGGGAWDGDHSSVAPRAMPPAPHPLARQPLPMRASVQVSAQAALLPFGASSASSALLPFGAPPVRSFVPSASGLTRLSTIRTLAEWVAPYVPTDPTHAPLAFSQLLRDANAPAVHARVQAASRDVDDGNDGEQHVEQHAGVEGEGKTVRAAVEAPSAQRLFLSVLWLVNHHNHTAGQAHTEPCGGAGGPRDGGRVGKGDPTALGRLPRGQQLELKVNDDENDLLLTVQP
mgnify:CR=1 FL=1